MRNTEVIIRSARCTGCGACYVACPQGAIALTIDRHGFLIPSINEDACVGCGKCLKVCPCNIAEGERSPLFAYACRTTSETLRIRCTSGGFVSALAEQVVMNGGVVYGACFEDGVRRVHHAAFRDVTSLEAFSGSKYVQSDCSGVLKGLVDGSLPCEGLFVGSPCQIAAVRNVLGKKGENLLTVDFACRGVPSPGVYERYCLYLESVHKSSIKTLVFRKKTYGYHGSTISIDFENGDSYEGNVKTDQMLAAFFSGYSVRPSCADCHMRKTPGLSDITVFECWHFESFTGAHDDNSGYTTVLINTERGKAAFDGLKSCLEVHTVDSHEAISVDGFILRENPPTAANSDTFWELLDRNGFGADMEKFLRITHADKIRAWVKRRLFSIGKPHN